MKRIFILTLFLISSACKTAKVDDEKSYITVETDEYSFQYPKTYDYYMSHGYPNYFPKEIYPRGKYNVVWLNAFYITTLDDFNGNTEKRINDLIKHFAKNNYDYQYTLTKTYTKLGETYILEDFNTWNFEPTNRYAYFFVKNDKLYFICYGTKGKYYDKYLSTFKRVFQTLKFKE